MKVFDPNDDHDVEALKRLNAEPWMVECLALNPGYVYWGPDEDAMTSKGAYVSSETYASLKDIPWGLDDRHEIVNFYFQLDRASRTCAVCTDPLRPLFEVTVDETEFLAECGLVRTNRGVCPDCEGTGEVFTEPAARLELALWVIHPRKGASRGVKVENIKREDLPAVFKLLAEAASRNAQRFAHVVRAAKEIPHDDAR